MLKLKDVTKSIRSKNAGPFQLTFDIFFKDLESYNKAKESKVISKELISQLYKTPVEDVLLVYCDNILAIKATIPRQVTCGSPDDRDTFGGQQYAPLMDVEMPA